MGMVTGITTISIPMDTDPSTITVFTVSCQARSIIGTADSPIAITALTATGLTTILL
ncbi:unnamed protein product, partial [Rotaria sp. Silwood1]